MAISKEKWTEIEEELAGFFPNIHFQYGEYKITVTRTKVSESTRHLCVYINDEIRGAWFSKKNERPSCIPDVWRQRTKAYYSPKVIKDIEKSWGKRRSKKQFPDLHSKQIYHDFTFTTAKSLVRQFKKLENLTLLEIA